MSDVPVYLSEPGGRGFGRQRGAKQRYEGFGRDCGAREGVGYGKLGREGVAMRGVSVVSHEET